MSHKTDDGGPAFPTEETEQYIAGWGMSLRDYFAAQAIAGMNIVMSSGGAAENKAAIAYEIADAMLARRRKQ